MKKERPSFHLFINTVFIGILLSFAVIYLTSTLIDTDSAAAPTCYDGTVISGNDFGSDFRRAVYQDKATLSFIREYQYKLFGIVDQSSVTMGSQSFLFELYDAEHRYNYLDDYTGNLSFTDRELEQILAVLEQRQQLCNDHNARYVLVVIPNSQTVYNECMPSYLGQISETTRLTGLKDYLHESGFSGVLDLTPFLLRAKSDGLLYHNTENALNARGLYYAYLAICNHISGNVQNGLTPIAREELEFFQYISAGRKAAQSAGVADFAPNRTVSLLSDMPINYDYVLNSGIYISTRLRDVPLENSTVLLQFSNAALRSQSELYFSNTIPEAIYQNRLSLSSETFHTASPQVVVQIISENELSRLLP